MAEAAHMRRIRRIAAQILIVTSLVPTVIGSMKRRSALHHSGLTALSVERLNIPGRLERALHTAVLGARHRAAAKGRCHWGCAAPVRAKALLIVHVSSSSGACGIVSLDMGCTQPFEPFLLSTAAFVFIYEDENENVPNRQRALNNL
jgi:hypothetical protein